MTFLLWNREQCVIQHLTYGQCAKPGIRLGTLLDGCLVANDHRRFTDLERFICEVDAFPMQSNNLTAP